MMQAHDILPGGVRPASSGKAAMYGALAGAGKFGKVCGVFIVAELLGYLHVSHLLFALKLAASVGFFFVQKPLGPRRGPLSTGQWAKVAQVGLLEAFVQTLWFYGITLCGPLRALLVFEASSPVVAGVLGTLGSGCRGKPARVRGAVFMLLGFLSLCLLDQDSSETASGHQSHQFGLSHIYDHVVGWFGVADHNGGVLLLAGAAVLRLGLGNAGRRLGAELEGGRRAAALSSAAATAALAIPAVLASLGGGGEQVPASPGFLHLLSTGALAALLLFILDFYTESLASAHVSPQSLSRLSPMLIYVLAFPAWALWEGGLGEEHGMSGGAALAALFFLAGTWSLTGAEGPRARAGEFVGYNREGRPLYRIGEDFLRRTSSSVLSFAKTTMGQIWASPDSRSIFYFLCLNLSFCGVEFLYGVLTNSLGLISDAFHMLFDCTSLVMGLVASVMSRWKPSGGFSYGYGRVEILSGFINGLFLVVISFFILVEALQRLYDPPHVHAEKLFVVSVAGLAINIFGLLVFSHAHTHGGKKCDGHGEDAHGHSHSHGHSHGETHAHSHGHSHEAKAASGGGGGNANMRGVYLHILADTGGSVAVILSSVIISYTGWHWMDPLCSLLLAALIFTSVQPLLRESFATIAQRTPPDLEEEFQEALHSEILSIPGVLSYSEPHLWELSSGRHVASLRIQAVSEAAEQGILGAATAALKRRLPGLGDVCVQVEKEAFLASIPNLLPNYPTPKRVSKTGLSDTLFVRAM